MELSFLHIGMMKTASTYMQSIWMKDKYYALCHKGNIAFTQELQKRVKEEKTDEKISSTLKLDAEFQQGQQLIISNEGFSMGFLNDPAAQDNARRYYDYSSRVLGALPNSPGNLLIVVREPLSWIKSIFVQAVKQGWDTCAQDFVEEQYDLLKNALDLKYIVNCYRRFFNNILIVPFELLKEDEKAFWQRISRRFEVPVPEAEVGQLNTSLSLKRTFLLAKLNGLSRVLLNTLINSEDYNIPREKQKITQTYKNDGKWVHRRFAEYATEKQINQMYDYLNISDIPEEFLEFSIPEELKQSVRINYIDYLKNYLCTKYTEQYEQAWNCLSRST